MDAIATYCDQGHRYELNGVPVPSVTQAMAHAGLDEYAGVPRRFLERAAAIGTAVHQACHFLDEDDLDIDSLAPETLGYVLSWQRFKENHKFVAIEIERSGVCVGPNGELPFGFRFDRIGIVDGVEYLLDLKTAQKRSPFWAVQTAGYSVGAAFDGPRACVQLYKTGMPGDLIPHRDDAGDRAEWERVLASAHWKISKGKKIRY